MRVQMLVYDIPETSDLQNPSAELHRRGIRLNLSCWAIPDGRVPWSLLSELSQGGATWYMVQFAQEEEVKICEMVVRSLTREVELAQRAAEHAEQRARELADDDMGRKQLVLYRRRAFAALSLAKRRLAAAEQCAEGFREERVTNVIEQARRRMEYLRARVENQADCFARAIQAMRQLPGEHAQSMTEAAQTGDLPAPIAADYLEETADDDHARQLADSLRRAFG